MPKSITLYNIRDLATCQQLANHATLSWHRENFCYFLEIDLDINLVYRAIGEIPDPLVICADIINQNSLVFDVYFRDINQGWDNKLTANTSVVYCGNFDEILNYWESFDASN
ncbi:MAG: hypothetical protein ACRDBG_01420 [Waterburya sp.]